MTTTPIADLTRLIDAHLPTHREGLAIVFYHVDQDENPFLKYQGQGKPDYHTSIRVAVKSALRAHPEALVVMLTDTATQFESLPMTVIRLPVVPEWLMYERTRCQLAFSQNWDGHQIHIDTDVILRKRFDPVFDWDADVALTGRPEMPGQHINGGMLVAKNPVKFTEFMADFVKNYDLTCQQKGSEDWDLHCFRGGQITLARMMVDCFPNAGRQRPADQRIGTDKLWASLYRTRWGTVAVAPSNLINWTFDPNNVSQDALAWHLKGPRKMFLPTLEAELTKTGAKFNAA